ncbi:Oligopeptide-binding protein OppA [Austwickia sp. TVS 96-490-7B]|uniref:peptide ABC transporter substrate-binding protein n=1 Tax=Austwickia sp. TVS 96-490-7B TaxID=2830843 RepID=UPI001C55A266|nr:ABC transporter substrate-binding protein [Austwickia sp. TVS 96-490-7B]MBW3086005.1 Oligopeptide-binding protein OppA [Austwickia sp. TVS 96-490-7B]
MRAKTRAAIVVGLCATSLVAASCGGGDSSGGSLGNAITVHGCNPQNDLIPANTNETCAGNVLTTTVAGLVRYNKETAKPENDIAEKIETSDSKTFNVTLKKGYKFSDGTEVKADNFIKAWNYAAYGPNAMVAGTFLEPVEGYAEVSKSGATVKEMSGLKKVDDYSFSITLANPVSDFPLRLGYTAFAPMPDAFFADPKGGFGKKPISAGPYMVTKWDANQQIVVEKNPHYSGAFKGNSDKITFRIYQDIGAAYKDLLANNLDVIDDMPADAINGLKYHKDLPDRWAMRNDVGVVQMVDFAAPKADPAVQNPKFKKAISMAIDRQTIVDKVFAGERRPLDSWVAPKVVGDYPEGTCGDFCKYNPDKARELLKEAGGFSGTLTIGFNGDSAHRSWAEPACQSITNTLGIKCEADAKVDFKTFRNAVKNREIKGMFRAGWQMDYPSPETFLAPLYGTGGSSNDNDYSNAAFDAKLKEAAAAKSTAEGFKLYHEAEQMLTEQMPSVPLWTMSQHAGWSTKVTNVKITPFGIVDYASIKQK